MSTCWPAKDSIGSAADALVDDEAGSDDPAGFETWPDDRLRFGDPSGTYLIVGSRRGIFGWGRRRLLPTSRSSFSASSPANIRRLDASEPSHSGSGWQEAVFWVAL